MDKAKQQRYNIVYHLSDEHIVICCDCGERLKYLDHYAKEHEEKFPTHQRYKIVLEEDEPPN